MTRKSIPTFPTTSVVLRMLAWTFALSLPGWIRDPGGKRSAERSEFRFLVIRERLLIHDGFDVKIARICISKIFMSGTVKKAVKPNPVWEMLRLLQGLFVKLTVLNYNTSSF